MEFVPANEQALSDEKTRRDREHRPQPRNRELAQRETEEKYRGIFENAAEGIFQSTPDGHFLTSNPTLARILGYESPADLLQNLTDIERQLYVEPEQRAEFKRQLEASDVVQGIETHVYRKDGSKIWLSANARCVCDEQGKVLYYEGIVQDISERKRAERRLAAQHAVTRVLAEFETLSEASPKILQAICECLDWQVGAIWNVDKSANVLRCVEFWHAPSIQVVEFESITRSFIFETGIGLPGRVWSSGLVAWIPDVTKDANFPRSPHAARDGLHGAFGFPIRIGNQVLGVIEFFSYELRQPDEDLLQMMANVGSQVGQFIVRKRAEESLRSSEERFRSLVIATSQIIWITNAQGEVVGDLPSWRAYTGQAIEAMQGLGWLQAIHPDERRRTAEKWAHAVATASLYETEYRLRKYDGSYRHMAARGVPIVAGGESWRYLPSPDFSLHDVSLVEDPSQVQEWVGTCMDVSDQKEAESSLRQIAAELSRSNRDLQEFAYVISHDLQAPLRIVTNYLQLLQRRYQNRLGTDADEFIAFAVEGAGRMKELIEGILAYSRVGSHGKPLELVDCKEIVQTTIANLQLAIHDCGARVTCDELPTVLADGSQLIQLFQNLIENAVKFRSDRPPEIHIGVEQTDTEWRFSVRDNGIGMDAEHSDRIFHMFQRLHTREQYPGTGIGLAICKKIVLRHGGRIGADSQPGMGSVISFTLPITPHPPAHLLSSARDS